MEKVVLDGATPSRHMHGLAPSACFIFCRPASPVLVMGAPPHCLLGMYTARSKQRG